MKAYLYENKAYPEKKPDPEYFKDFDDVITNYEKALKEWSTSGKIVQNAEIMLNQFAPDYNICVHFGNIDYGDYTYDYAKSGQKVETEPSEDKVIVTKIY